MPRTNLQGLTWRTSSYSGGTDHGGCVAVARTADAVAVRDSKQPAGPILLFAEPAWRSLTER